MRVPSLMASGRPSMLTTVLPGITIETLPSLESTLMTVKSSISLTDEQHSFARTLVEAGRFPSVSAVLQQGVDLLRRQMEDEALERAALAEIMKQRRSGEFFSVNEMDERLLRMLDMKRQAHAVRN